MAAIKKYCIEIYQPGSLDKTLKRINTDLPPLSIHRGDFLNCGALDKNAFPSDCLRVTAVEHLLLKDEKDFVHKINIFTQHAEDEDFLAVCPR